MMEILSNSPATAQLMLACILLPFFGGVLAWLCKTIGNLQRDFAMKSLEEIIFLGTVICVWLGTLCLIPHVGASFLLPNVAGFGLSFCLDGLRLVLILLASSCWLVCALFTPIALAATSNKRRFYLFMLCTEGATLGVFLSGDLYTTLLFFEIMSVTSWVLVAHDETPKTMYAADSYLAFAVLGGLSTLMGLFLLYNTLGTLTIAELATAAAQCNDQTMLYIASAFTLVGFAAKAGMFPLHTWLPTAYLAAPAPATALLSAILSKAGIFGILIISTQVFMGDAAFGTVILCFALITMVTGAVLGVFSTNLKRTLACSSMSQIGFILVGVGMQCILGEEGGLAFWGVVLHICNHSLFKLGLFLCAGVMFANLSAFDLNTIRGFGRGKYALMYPFAMAAIGIGGVPLWSGYISKTLLHESIVEGIAHYAAHGHATLFLECTEWIFLCSGGLTVAYMTKLFVCVFLETNSDPTLQAKYNAMNKTYLSKLQAFTLVVVGSISPLLGMSAHLSMERIATLATPFALVEAPAHAVHYFSAECLKGGGISLLIGAVLYFGVVRTVFLRGGVYRNLWPSKLNLEDLLYRPMLSKVLPFLGAVFARFVGSIFEWIRAFACRILFAKDNGGIVVPEEDAHFTVYEQLPKGVRGFTGSLAFSLMMFGFGMISILLYVVSR